METPIAKETFEFRNMLAKKGIIFNYTGYVTEDILTSVGAALRSRMASEGADKGTARRSFSIFVEQMQNIIRYSGERISVDQGEEQADLRYGLLSVGTLDDKYFISCSNLVRKAEADRLNAALQEISKMTSDELKTAYKETLRRGPPKGSKGAGVGLIDIARQATYGIEFGFQDLDNDMSYFCLKAYV
jgi:hypothetical protein